MWRTTSRLGCNITVHKLSIPAPLSTIQRRPLHKNPTCICTTQGLYTHWVRGWCLHYHPYFRRRVDVRVGAVNLSEETLETQGTRHPLSAQAWFRDCLLANLDDNEDSTMHTSGEAWGKRITVQLLYVHQQNHGLGGLSRPLCRCIFWFLNW